MSIKVIVVEDHYIVRSGIEQLLSAVAGISVRGMADFDELSVMLSKELAKEEQPHVVLMDSRMPASGRCDAIRKILHSNHKTKIIALTADIAGSSSQQLLQAGVVGFLTKIASLEEMVVAIKTVYAGKKYLGMNVSQSLALKSITGSKSLFSQLSDRELQIMLMVVNGKKVEEVADLLSLSKKAVNSYRYKIFSKLTVTNDVELTRYAIKQGLGINN